MFRSQTRLASVLFAAVLLVFFCIVLIPSTLSYGQIALNTETPFPTFEPLATQVGFSDAEIARLQAKGAHLVNDNLEFVAFHRTYRLLSFKPSAYLNKPADQEYSYGQGTVLLYRVENGAFRLVWKQETEMDDPYLTFRERFPAPGDWHNDGHILIAIWKGWWTTSWYQGHLDIYELHADETLVPVLKNIIPPGYVAESVMKQSDGKNLLVAGDYRDGLNVMGLSQWSLYTCCGPYLHRYFEWQNGQYVDVSAEHPDQYFAEMGSALQFVTTTKDIANVTMPSGGTITKAGPELFSLNLLRLLAIYEDMGEREAGWNLVHSLVTEAKRSGRLVDGTYVDQVFMPTMTKLFESGKPFIAPEYVLYHWSLEDYYSDTRVVLYPN